MLTVQGSKISAFKCFDTGPYLTVSSCVTGKQENCSRLKYSSAEYIYIYIYIPTKSLTYLRDMVQLAAQCAFLVRL